MSLFINTNSEAMIAQNNLNTTESALNSAMTDLSSGLRINTAADDAAGYAITEDLTAQVNGLNQASSNVQDGVSLIQTADGAVNDVEQMLQRVRELAVEYNGGTLDATDKNAIVSEVTQLTCEIQQVGQQAQFNGITLFNDTTVTFQVGANDGETISVTISSLSDTGVLASLIGSGASTFSLGSATILTQLSCMIDSVSSIGASLGAVQNRLSYTLDNLSTYSENLSSAQSTIQDVDMASEMTEFTKDQILQQSGISMLSQAEQNPQAVLKLLGA